MKLMKNQDLTNVKFAVMRLGERKFVFDLLKLQEIVLSPIIEPSLDGPDLQVGMFNSSSGSLPVLDLLSRPPDECRLWTMAMVVFVNDGGSMCLLADEVLDYVEFSLSDLCPLPDGANGIADDLLSGVITHLDCDYYLLDLGALRSVWNRIEEKTEKSES